MAQEEKKLLPNIHLASAQTFGEGGQPRDLLDDCRCQHVAGDGGDLGLHLGVLVGGGLSL